MPQKLGSMVGFSWLLALYVCCTGRNSAHAFRPLVSSSRRQLSRSVTLSKLLAGQDPSYTNGDIVQSEYIPLECFEEDSDVHEDISRLSRTWDTESILNIAVPAVMPVLAFMSYDAVAKQFEAFVQLLSNNNWVAVDGGAYQAKIIAPALNGIVLPAVAVLFATLTSTTINTLRLRQVQIRSAINMEGADLRALETLLESFAPGIVQDRCREYLIQYTSRLISESEHTMGTGEDIVNPRRGMDSELNGFMRVINEHYGDQIPPHIGDECYNAIRRLREQRKARITALQSTYPSLHWIILSVLSGSECVGFLMEANQDVLVFLNAVQLKVLWAMLVGTFTACFTVFIDLASPFGGSYTISPSVQQLHTIRLTLQASAVKAHPEFYGKM